MRAFVLSGGGNRGPLEVGAIRVLFEHGIRPEMIVGSSAGALNGAFLAADPTPEQAARMAELWREAGRRRIAQGSAWRSLLQLLRGKTHAVDNRALAQYVREALPPNKRTFGDMAVPLYVTIAHLATHTLYVYGDDPAALVADAVVTSAAVPSYFPPTLHQGEVFVDGGVVSNLPLRLAIARGATEIWAIDLSYCYHTPRQVKGGFSMLGLTIMPVLYTGVLREIENVMRAPGVTIHHVPIEAYSDVGLGDYSKTEAMFEEGARVMREYLARPEPNIVHYPRRLGEKELPPGPPGSRPFLL